MSFLRKIFILELAFLPVVCLAYVNPGKPAGFVNDFAGVLSVQEKSQLEMKLSDFNQKTGNEIAVVAIQNLGGDTIENFAVRLFQDWGIGQKGKDNGILVLVSKEDREIRIEVGYGLEGALTDAQSYWIIQDIILPAFKNGDFYGGLNAGTDKIIAAIEGEQIPGLSGTNKPSNKMNIIDWFWLVGFGFIWLAAILGRSKSWWAGGVIGGIIGIIILFVKGILIGLIAVVILIPFGLFIDFFASRAYAQNKEKGVRPPWWLGGGGFGDHRGGGGFGGFGGGHSGGGGASGKW